MQQEKFSPSSSLGSHIIRSRVILNSFPRVVTFVIPRGLLLDSNSIHVLVVPDALHPRILLALAALNVSADRVGTHSAAVRADHLSASNLVTRCAMSALQESRSLLAVREAVRDVAEGFLSAKKRLRIVFVDLGGKISGFVGAASASADSAALVHASGAFQIAGMPGSTGVWVARIWLVGGIVIGVTVQSGA